MARGFRRGRTSSRGPKRKTQWEWAEAQDDASDYLIGASGAGNAGITALWMRPPAGAVDTLFDPNTFRWPGDVTLMRTRVTLNSRVGPIPAEDNIQRPAVLHFGLIKWPKDDDVPPVQAPDPSNGGYDWIWREEVALIFLSAAGSSAIDHKTYDSMARRKIDQNEGILLCVAITSALESVIGNNIGPVGWSLYMRWLVKLP